MLKRNVRRNARVQCSMAGMAEGPGGAVRGIVRNLSRGGMFFLSSTLLPIGHTVDMKLDLPGEKPVTAMGEVRYHYKYADGQGMGIRFLRLGVEDLAVISTFVHARAGALLA